MKRLVIALGTATILTACGSGPGGTHYGSAKDVATAFGCSGYKAADQSELFAADTGECNFQGHFEDVNWFTDADTLKSWLDTGSAFGGSTVHGADWAISCSGRVDCVAIQKKLGGTLN
jgi:hypothetical protein